MMLQPLIRYLLSVSMLVLLLQGLASGQEFILPYGKPPETPEEFWAALKQELSLGNQRRTAAMLQEFWGKFSALNEQQQNDLLLKLYDQDGVSLFLRLGNIQTVREKVARDPGSDKDRPIAEILTGKVNQAVEARLGDQGRIKFFIDNLGRSPEERGYAITQLRAAGARAVPQLINALRDKSRTPAEHQRIYSALLKMNRDIGPALLGVLDAQDADLRSEIINLFVQRGDNRIVPHLWFLQAWKDQPEKARQLAGEALTGFTKASGKELLQAPAKLTQEAERYYYHQVETPAGTKPTIWRWSEEAGLSAQPVTPSHFEEHYGAYWARKALELDPTYRPAQIVFVSVLLEKAIERGGMEQPLSKIAPEIHGLLAATRSSLLEAVLDRAMNERRTPVVLGACRALARVSEWRLARASEKGLPPLVRALNYPDRRVQLAAADALLHIPNSEPFQGNSRVIEVLKRAAASDLAPRALIGYSNAAAGQQLAARLQAWGYEPLMATTGRQLVALAHETSDIEIIFVEPGLLDPGLNPMLAQLRASADTSSIPVVVMAQPEQESSVRTTVSKYAHVLVVSPPPASDEMLKHQLDPFIKKADRTPLSDAERKAHAALALDWLLKIAQGQKPGYDIRPAESAMLRALGTDELAGPASASLAHRPGRHSQNALAEAALNATRAAPVRAEAVRHLHLHIQRHGILLKPEQLDSLLKLPGTVEDPALKEVATRLAVSLRGDPHAEGHLLRQFQPPPPKAPMAEGDK